MVWEVEGTDEFAEWFGTLTEDQQEALDDRVNLSPSEDPTLVARRSIGCRDRVITR